MSGIRGIARILATGSGWIVGKARRDTEGIMLDIIRLVACRQAGNARRTRGRGTEERNRSLAREN